MSDRLPLHALRAFESAARHLNYSRAADELFLTHSAVSHQIKALEQTLGVKLFRRSGRAMLLTAEGQRLHARVHDGFERLRRGIAELKEGKGRSLRISVLPGFAARWLLPRLPDFYRRYPELELDLRTGTALTDFNRDDVDLAVRYGPGGWSGVHAEKLMDEDIFPVCSPGYAGGKLPRTAQDLLSCTLLHNFYEPWEDWFRMAGVTPAAMLPGPRFSESNLMLQAAVQGQGVALALGTLVQAELRDGRLVRCHAGQRARFAYYLVHPDADPVPTKVAAFKEWMHRQAEAP